MFSAPLLARIPLLPTAYPVNFCKWSLKFPPSREDSPAADIEFLYGLVMLGTVFPPSREDSPAADFVSFSTC